ncbi:hypothetical protein [Polyangium sp. 15x6]|uniref:hypothetical protein n=1 Tax=Polyangium sp. 15x6 TaxID=3042687 RepID=UPI00249BBE68|nr:hypothetical protein [Polyangium sp. 15x6]MDI3287953.1 hypothetical protein [Polyangium sp. 15x6]
MIGRNHPRVAALFLGATFAVTLADSASAEAPPDVRATAEKLYQDAYVLALEGHHARACEMYEESDRLDPANGTKLELARCYEATARPASAWALYVAVAEADKATGKNRAREAEARARADALEAELPKLVLMVPASVADRAGLSITRDGVSVGEALWGAPMPVDLGKHTIRAIRPDRLPWESVVNVSKNGETVTVAIPPPAAWAPPRIREVPRGRDERRSLGPPPVLALALGGVALAGFTVGGVTGGLAFAKWEEVKEMAPRQCGAPASLSGCTQAVADKGAEASRFAGASTAGFVVGGAALAAGAIIWLTSVPGKRPAAGRFEILPAAGPSGVGGVVRGAF